MQKNRLEAFSDGVMAIVITILVLELKAPHGYHFSDLMPLLPKFIGYVLSFIYIAIYWNNHHHMLHTVKQVSGNMLWANMHLLFWLSLVPFVTAWMGENHFESLPVALYGVVLLMAAVAYTILQMQILASHGNDSVLAKAVGKDFKGKLSIVSYVLAIIAAFWIPIVSGILFVLVAFIWLIPDKRIEKVLDSSS
jgi:uncharacterized membrane protein